MDSALHHFRNHQPFVEHPVASLHMPCLQRLGVTIHGVGRSLRQETESKQEAQLHAYHSHPSEIRAHFLSPYHKHSMLTAEKVKRFRKAT
ncbi:Calcyphosin-Like Protein [Manis pentadactyla]|nr:Calcyphosin-Like Protein [Manis pentadactyla]